MNERVRMCVHIAYIFGFQSNPPSHHHAPSPLFKKTKSPQVKTIQDAIVKFSSPANRDLEYQHLPAGTPPVKARAFCVSVCVCVPHVCMCARTYLYVHI